MKKSKQIFVFVFAFLLLGSFTMYIFNGNYKMMTQLNLAQAYQVPCNKLDMSTILDNSLADQNSIVLVTNERSIWRNTYVSFIGKDPVDESCRVYVPTKQDLGEFIRTKQYTTWNFGKTLVLYESGDLKNQHSTEWVIKELKTTFKPYVGNLYDDSTTQLSYSTTPVHVS